MADTETVLITIEGEDYDEIDCEVMKAALAFDEFKFFSHRRAAIRKLELRGLIRSLFPETRTEFEQRHVSTSEGRRIARMVVTMADMMGMHKHWWETTEADRRHHYGRSCEEKTIKDSEGFDNEERTVSPSYETRKSIYK